MCIRGKDLSELGMHGEEKSMLVVKKTREYVSVSAVICVGRPRFCCEVNIPENHSVCFC